MLSHIRRRLSFANVASTLALLIALSTAGAYAATYVISSNKDVAPNTISGHKPPAGDHANLVPGSITAADLTAPEAWHTVAAHPNPYVGGCPQEPVAFCSDDRTGEWSNSGGSFAPAAYTRDLQGSVELRGLVSDGLCFSPVRGPRWTSAIFALPSGYRPAHELVFTALDNDVHGSHLVRLDVGSDGLVQLYNDMATADDAGGTCAQFVSLDGISFRTDA